MQVTCICADSFYAEPWGFSGAHYLLFSDIILLSFLKLKCLQNQKCCLIFPQCQLNLFKLFCGYLYTVLNARYLCNKRIVCICIVRFELACWNSVYVAVKNSYHFSQCSIFSTTKQNTLSVITLIKCSRKPWPSSHPGILGMFPHCILGSVPKCRWARTLTCCGGCVPSCISACFLYCNEGTCECMPWRLHTWIYIAYCGECVSRCYITFQGGYMCVQMLITCN